MPDKNSLNHKRETALKLLEESDPELAKALREELKNRGKAKSQPSGDEVQDNKDFEARIASLITRYKPKLRYTKLSDPCCYFFGLS
jgi:hypothetical protein